MPSGSSGWLSLVNHALALGDLSEVDYLELKGALAFAERPQRRRAAVVVSRAILGMANRMPDVASRHLGGFGVIFIGINQAQEIDSAEEVDGATLRDLVQPYLGEDGPRWDHQYIQHPDGLVLAVVVDPPQWGDSIRSCRRDYSDDVTKLVVRDGDVFVRLPGKTRPATSHDLSQLELRRSKAPHSGAQVHLECDGAFDRASRASVRELIGSLVASAADDLLAGLPDPGPGSIYGVRVEGLLGGFSVPTDRRRPDAFRDQVDAWIEMCREDTDHVVTEFLRHHLSRSTFTIVNDSDRYLEGVRVQVAFPRTLVVLTASDTDYCDHGGKLDVFRVLPDRPLRYGTMEPFGLGGLTTSALTQFRQ